MRNLWKLVRSPRHLLVFEAAARLSSFTKAAAELNVSQPAVSLAVRQLETALGLRLFTRGHRAIALTRAGERLFDDVTFGFSRILETAAQLHRQGRKSHVTLSVSTAFANYWMVPRLAQFHRDNPGDRPAPADHRKGPGPGRRGPRSGACAAATAAGRNTKPT